MPVIPVLTGGPAQQYWRALPAKTYCSTGAVPIAGFSQWKIPTWVVYSLLIYPYNVQVYNFNPRTHKSILKVS